MSTTATHAWRRRLSDYHSGSVSDAERAAVAAHLQTCPECQEVLAMYRHFYLLLRSPLRLGAPSMAFMEDAPTVVTPAPTAPSQGQPARQQPPRPRRKLVAGIAAGLAAAVIVAGFLAVLATRGTSPSIASTPVPHHTATTAPLPTNTASATPAATTAPPAPSAFVCANPTGSQLVYAYVRGDGNVYIVKGCAVSGALVPDAAYSQPVAWSPSNEYLMIDEPKVEGGDQLVAIDTMTGKRSPTSFSLDYNPSATPGDTAHIFIGWLDDSTFLGVNVPITQQGTSGAPIGRMSLVKVGLNGGSQIVVTKITWAARFAIRDQGKYLFYSGYQSTSEGGASLHRVDLASGADTRITPLGIAGPGPCQGTPICPWTAPWDASADGTHVLYHNPGPTSTPSDTSAPADTPLYYANVDGSSAVKLFGGKLATALTAPVLSPDNTYVIVSGDFTAGQSGQIQTGIERLGGGDHFVNGAFMTWRGDSQAMVLVSGAGNYSLYTLGDGATHPLEANAVSYVWGN